MTNSNIDQKMTPKEKDDIRNSLIQRLGRQPNPHEVENIYTDALQIAHFLIDKVNALEGRITILEKGKAQVL